MSEKPVLVAQISDLHIKAPGSLAYGRVDTARALERCVAALNALDPAPDFVVISGDLADTPTAAEYEYLGRLLQPLELPYAAVPGNRLRACTSGDLDAVRGPSMHDLPGAQSCGGSRSRATARAVFQG